MEVICGVVSGTNIHLEIGLDSNDVLAEGCVKCEKANICNYRGKRSCLFSSHHIP